MTGADKTSKERQARRRKKEKIWLSENGWKSWEAIHTALLKGFVKLIKINHNHEGEKNEK